MMKFGNVKKELAAVEGKISSNSAKEAKEVVGENAVISITEQPKVQSIEIAVPEKSKTITERKQTVENQPSTSYDIGETEINKDEDLTNDADKILEQRMEVRKRQNEEETEYSQKKRKPRIRKEKWEEYGTGCENKDEQYATWMPPENQSGDGKTLLHEKFGGKY